MNISTYNNIVFSEAKARKEYGVLAMKEGLEFHFHHTITMIIGKDGVIKHIFYGEDAISDEVIERVRDVLFREI